MQLDIELFNFPCVPISLAGFLVWIQLSICPVHNSTILSIFLSHLQSLDFVWGIYGGLVGDVFAFVVVMEFNKC